MSQQPMGVDPATDAAAQSDENIAAETPAENTATPETKVSYSVSPGFVSLLHRLNISIAASSYQSGKFYLLGRNPKGGLMIDERLFQKAMGIYVAENSLLLATLFQILRFENVLEADQKINFTQDACYVPRLSYTTGILDMHDVGLDAEDAPVFVNTRFNCLARASARHSFEEIWRPPFVSRLVDEDRCHLNGLAMRDGAPAFVTAVSRSDTIDGWRDRRSDGGVVVDVGSNEVIATGLSMPHSPRWYQGKLWLLNSGTGGLGYIEPGSGNFVEAAFCPGFVRGLAFHGDYAFVGLSKPRYQRFEGLALDNRLQETDSEPWCGLQVIDLNSGRCAEWFRIDGAVAEMYDVAVIPDVSCPMSVGFASPEIFNLITYPGLEPKQPDPAGQPAPNP